MSELEDLVAVLRRKLKQEKKRRRRASASAAKQLARCEHWKARCKQRDRVVDAALRFVAVPGKARGKATRDARASLASAAGQLERDERSRT